MERSNTKTFDELADWYADWVQSTSWIHGVLEANLPALWDSEPPQVVLDVACGEGVFSRMLADAGHTVVGIDQSSRLIAVAEERSGDAHLSIVFRVDDAQTLETCADAAFDGALCVLALMDIPDLDAVYGAVRRIVRFGGWLVIAITHPCFDSPHADWIETPEGTARLVMHYLDEGHWQSRLAESVRGRVGAHHRTLSTYLNAAIAAGWVLERIVEPASALADQNPSIPRVLLARFH